MLGILFINILVVFLIVEMLFPIINDRINFFFKLILSVVMIALLNSAIVFVFSWFNLSCNLLARTVIFGIFAVIGLLFIVKHKEVQKFELKTIDLIAIVFLFIVTSLLGRYRFKENMDLYFETTDPAVHYIFAESFAESNQLSEKRTNRDFFYTENEQATMFLSYTTLGTIFQIENELGFNQVTHVNSFVIFELVVLFLLGCLIYLLITSTSKKFKFINYILTLGLTALALSGYPFNNLIFGYHYLGICILLILLFIKLLDLILDNYNYKLIFIASLIAFNIFTSYYMFVPVIFGASGAYLLYQWFVTKKLKFNISFKIIIFVLVIPFILGIWYYFVRNYFISSSGTSGVDTFKLEGYIYRNLIGNFILLFIVTISKLIYDIKNKSITLSDLTLIFTFLFLVILFVPFYNGVIASYYFYKLHYLMWPLCFVILGESFYSSEIEFSQTMFSKVILCCIALLFVMEIKDVDEKLYQKNPLINPTGFVSNLVNIYNFNEDKVNKRKVSPIYTQKELRDIIDLSDKNKSDMNGENVIFYANLFQKLWFYDFSRINPNGEKDYLGSFYEDNLDYNELYENANIKYVVCYIDNCDDISKNYYDEKYKNESFGLLVRKEIVEKNTTVSKKKK